MKANQLVTAALRALGTKDVMVDTGDGNYRKIAATVEEDGQLIIRLAPTEPPDEGPNN